MGAGFATLLYQSGRYRAHAGGIAVKTRSASWLVVGGWWLVSGWLAPAAVPSPESYFGQRMGADHLVLDWDKVVSYFQTIKANSDRIRVDELGKSTEGRPFIAATIASPDTLRHLDRYLRNPAPPGRSAPDFGKPKPKSWSPKARPSS
jgi:hypothetical protein